MLSTAQPYAVSDLTYSPCTSNSSNSSSSSKAPREGKSFVVGGCGCGCCVCALVTLVLLPPCCCCCCFAVESDIFVACGNSSESVGIST